MKKTEIKKAVCSSYGKVAKEGISCCQTGSCCGGNATSIDEISTAIGYTSTEIGSVPEGANLGLGCGNPTAIASLKKGEVVLDLGSGAGFDCFLAARQVGKTGKVIGVDMTPEMIDKARDNADKNEFKNVEFRLGEIEHLPVADNAVDVVISNCVINLAPDKEQVFSEAMRVLKPGGRITISDIVLEKDLPESIRNSVAAYAGCIAGASLKEIYLTLIENAGFTDIKIVHERKFSTEIDSSDSFSIDLAEQAGITENQVQEIAATSIASITVTAIKRE